MKKDEGLFLGQSGEGVVSRDGMQALEKLNNGEGVGNVTINVNGVVTTDDIPQWMANLQQKMSDLDIGFNIKMMNASKNKNGD